MALSLAAPSFHAKVSSLLVLRSPDSCVWHVAWTQTHVFVITGLTARAGKEIGYSV